LNTLRPRFGKFFSESHPGRDIEIKISNYRKTVTDLGNLHEHLLNLASLMTHDKNELKQSQEKNSEEIIEQLGKPFFEVIHLYINNDKFSLEGVINIYISFKMMANAKNLLHSLNINPDQAVIDYQNKYFPNYSDELTSGDKCNILMGATYEIIANKYHINYSKWCPQKGYIGLAEAIKKEGAIAVSCNFFGFSIATSKSLQQRFGKWDLYGWDQTDFVKMDKSKSDFNIINRHRILIIGLQQYGEEKNVIYMDSNSPNSANGPNRIFKIPYDFLELYLTNVHSFNKVQEQGIIGPYGYIADLEYMRSIMNDFDEKTANNKISTLKKTC